MQNLKRIEGIETLLEKLPPEYQYWHKFGDILEFYYNFLFDDKNKFKNVACIHMILTDKDFQYKIKLDLMDVTGNISFDVTNGFYSGLSIEDSKDKYLENQWETGYCFYVTSMEQEVDFKIQCETICVEMLDE